MSSAESAAYVCMPCNDQDDNHAGWLIFCPGCKESHLFDKRWAFNGDRTKPTFKPSMMVRRGRKLDRVCHSFVTDGRMQFLVDCTHELAGTTHDLAPF